MRRLEKNEILLLIIFIGISFYFYLTNYQFAFRNQWKSTEYVSTFSIPIACDAGFFQRPVDLFFRKRKLDKSFLNNLQEGDCVWIESGEVYHFYKKILPFLNKHIILVISHGDQSFPGDSGLSFQEISYFLNHPFIIHFFAQNLNLIGYQCAKASPIPIGLNFHSQAYKQDKKLRKYEAIDVQEKTLEEIISNSLKTTSRKVKAYVDFQLTDNMHGTFSRYLEFGEDRTSIFNQIKNSGVIDYPESFIPRDVLWKKKTEYAFSISPPGNGIDCHRTWEDLALGCIVIVKSTGLDPLFEGLPVIKIKEWSEINEDNFHKWLNLYGDVLNNPSYRERLKSVYWINKIKAVQKESREETALPRKLKQE